MVPLMPFELILTANVEATLEGIERDPPRLRKVQKCLAKLENNPRQSGLNSHPYSQIQGPLGEKIFESYVENHAPSAWRVWWYYGPEAETIVIVDLGPHP